MTSPLYKRVTILCHCNFVDIELTVYVITHKWHSISNENRCVRLKIFLYSIYQYNVRTHTSLLRM